MAIALQRTPTLPRQSVLKPVLVLVAALILAVGVGLSGGFRLAGPQPSVERAHSEAGVAPAYDNRGKWTGY